MCIMGNMEIREEPGNTFLAEPFTFCVCVSERLNAAWAVHVNANPVKKKPQMTLLHTPNGAITRAPGVGAATRLPCKL